MAGHGVAFVPGLTRTTPPGRVPRVRVELVAIFARACVRAWTTIRSGVQDSRAKHGERQGFYDDPAIYDILHTPGTAEEVEGLLRIARRHAPTRRPRRWIEPACGSGRYLRVLSARGERALGFDLSASMVEYARKRLDRLALRHARACVAPMETFADALGLEHKFEVGFNLINSIRHLPGEAAMREHLGQMRRALVEGGIYIVGISISAYGLEAASEDVWEGRRGSCHVRQLVSYLPPDVDLGEGHPRARLERVISQMTVTTPAGERQIGSTFDLFCYDVRQWRAVVASAAYEIVACVDEDGRETPEPEPGYALFILRPR